MSKNRNKSGSRTGPGHHIQPVDDKSPYQHPGELDEDYWLRFGYLFAKNRQDPELKAIYAQLNEVEVNPDSPNYSREIEHIRLSRLQLQRITDWQSLGNERQLNTEQILTIILSLYDKAGSQQKLPFRYPLLADIYAGLDSGKLIPDIEGIFDWTQAQGYKLFEPPCGIPSRRPTMPTWERDNALQRAANSLAKEWVKDGKQSFTKKDIADALAAKDEYCHMTSDRIQRIIRKNW